MKSWKSKLFGDSSMNFYGWLLAGLLACGASLYFVVRGLVADPRPSSQQAILLAIYFMLLGIFCLALQNYLARVAEKLDAPSSDTKDDHAG